VSAGTEIEKVTSDPAVIVKVVPAGLRRLMVPESVRCVAGSGPPRASSVRVNDPVPAWSASSTTHEEHHAAFTPGEGCHSEAAFLREAPSRSGWNAGKGGVARQRIEARGP